MQELERHGMRTRRASEGWLYMEVHEMYILNDTRQRNRHMVVVPDDAVNVYMYGLAEML